MPSSSLRLVTTPVLHGACPCCIINSYPEVSFSHPPLHLPDSERKNVNDPFLHVDCQTSTSLLFYHPNDYRCLGQLHHYYWNRPLQEPFCRSDRTFKFS